MHDDDDFYLDYDDEDAGFAQQGSALRASSPNNPRNLPCPTCHTPNVLTREDKMRGYQCDRCADNTERFGGPFGL